MPWALLRQGQSSIKAQLSKVTRWQSGRGCHGGAWPGMMLCPRAEQGQGWGGGESQTFSAPATKTGSCLSPLQAGEAPTPLTFGAAMWCDGPTASPPGAAGPGHGGQGQGRGAEPGTRSAGAAVRIVAVLSWHQPGCQLGGSAGHLHAHHPADPISLPAPAQCHTPASLRRTVCGHC